MFQRNENITFEVPHREYILAVLKFNALLFGAMLHGLMTLCVNEALRKSHSGEFVDRLIEIEFELYINKLWAEDGCI